MQIHITVDRDGELHILFWKRILFYSSLFICGKFEWDPGILVCLTRLVIVGKQFFKLHPVIFDDVKGVNTLVHANLNFTLVCSTFNKFKHVGHSRRSEINILQLIDYGHGRRFIADTIIVDNDLNSTRTITLGLWSTSLGVFFVKMLSFLVLRWIRHFNLN